MKKPLQRTVIVRIPDDVFKRLDKAAKRSGRSRSAEVRLRMVESLARCQVLATAESAAGAGT